jgi:hypothetical protein
MTSSEIEPATFPLLAQCLNKLRYRVMKLIYFAVYSSVHAICFTFLYRFSNELFFMTTFHELNTKRSPQQFLSSCLRIRFRGNLFTKPLPSNRRLLWLHYSGLQALRHNIILHHPIVYRCVSWNTDSIVYWATNKYTSLHPGRLIFSVGVLGFLVSTIVLLPFCCPLTLPFYCYRGLVSFEWNQNRR